MVPKTILYKTYSSTIEANIALSKLKDNDIPCFLANEASSNILQNYSGIMGSGIQLYIIESDLDKVKNLLIENKEEIICPNCSSKNIKVSLGRNKFKKLFMIFLSLLSSQPFGNITPQYSCKDCKYKFE